ncbi:MAG: hypothetical protein ACAH59_06035 [Pseudobdellovibrionaceae bacterium]
MTMKKWITIGAWFLCFPFLGCSNVFEGMADTTSDEALLEDARKFMNDQEWGSAIEKFEALSDSKQQEEAVIQDWATAYAGRCGLEFIDYFVNLGSADLSSSTIFNYLMNAWTGESVNPSDCALAQAKMEEISIDPAERTSEQNLFMAILGMVKVGVYLRSNLDINGSDNAGDGTAELSACTDTNSPGVDPLDDSELNQLITGVGLISSNLDYLTEVLESGDITDSLTEFRDTCDSIGAPCELTDASAVTDANRDAFRDLLNTGSANPSAGVGVGSCVNAAVNLCCP